MTGTLLLAVAVLVALGAVTHPPAAVATLALSLAFGHRGVPTVRPGRRPPRLAVATRATLSS